MFDHIGGINTLFYGLTNKGCVITLPARDPTTVSQQIEAHKVEVLPASPSFLNMILMEELHKRFDLSSLKLITYGTEVMPDSVLKRLVTAFPGVKLQQTYGLSELGIMSSQSESNNSPWIKVGGVGYETKIVDGILHVRSETSMMGYLNAPSPFDGEGWFNTQDQVEVRGEWLRIKGRKDDIINVGGEKVYPSEVESVILEVRGVEEVVVEAEPSTIMGSVVVARIWTQQKDFTALKKDITTKCKDRLERYKIPVKIKKADTEKSTTGKKRNW
jgi:acyl-CoA synthetase (AMP-forming)/AMP-acid ligase II